MKPEQTGLFAAVVVAAGMTVPVEAQVNVQQPVVGGFRASTTVSVPDRGSAHLGSVGSAASGRINSGIFRPGTSSGLERSTSSVSTSVYIHDLRAMDEALLAGTANSQRDAWSPRLEERRAAIPTGITASRIEDTSEKAARYVRLAREAESKGKGSVARMHWNLAAKFGSTVAKQRLTELASVK